ncbi:MAG: endonuclease domain-containing protein [Natronosporangium sp.]
MVGFWVGLPPSRVVQLVGASPEAIALALEPLPADAPAVLTCHATTELTSAGAMLAALLDQLERAALDLYPAWLPGASGLDGPGGAGVHAVRALAAEKSAGTPHFGPFLAELAARAIGGGSGRDPFPTEVRAAGLARVIADSFERAHVALLMQVDGSLPPTAEQATVAASEWLAHYGGFAVWLTGPELRTSDRVPRISVRLPEQVASLAGVDPDGTGPAGPGFQTAPAPATLQVPALAGRPHPASKAEQALEAALANLTWATGRVWNQTFQADPLTNPIRVDLLWPVEKCAIEIDGAEHRGVLHYEADRRRDVLLQLAGFTVLRFTNSQTLTDTGTVLSQIEQLLTTRRLRRDTDAG